MAWPTTTVSTAKLDETGDNLDEARADLLDAVQKLNDIINARGENAGVAPLGGDGKIAGTYFDADALLTVLLDADGWGSGLDADLLDGLEGSAYALTDLSRVFACGPTYMLDVEKTTTAINISTTVAEFTHKTSGTPDDDFGLSIDLKLQRAVGGSVVTGRISSRWDDASNDDASLDLWAMEGLSTVRQLRMRDYHLEIYDVTPTTYPPSGAVWIFAKGGSLYYRTSSTEVGPLAAAGGGADHGGLTGLGDDDHSQYLLVSGTRAMTGEFETGANAIHATELGAKPSQPGGGEWKLYFKSGGLYILDDGDNESQVSAGGVSDHGALAGLTPDDDHPQYLLRQPAADVVINESGGDFNIRIESTGLTNMFLLDAGFDAIGIGTTPADGTVRLTAVHTGSDHAIKGQAAGGFGIVGIGTTGGGVYGYSAATGLGGYFHRDATSTPSLPVVSIKDDNASYGYYALIVTQDCPTAGVARFFADENKDVFTIDATEAVFNEGGLTNYDVRIEGDTLDHLFFADSSTDTVAINGPLTTGRFNVAGGTLDGIYATTSQSGKYAGKFAGGLTAGGLSVSSNSGTALLTNSSTGRSAWIARNTVESPTNPVLHVEAQSNTDAGPVVKIDNAGTGQLLDIYDAGTRIFEMIDPGALGGVITNWRECSSAPTQADTNFWRVYFLSDGMYYRDDAGTAPVGPLGGAGGGGTFISLTDTPSSYTGQQNKVTTVNNVANAIEFADLWYEAGVLAFVGTTSSYPALKRSTNILEAWLADSSAYTDFGAKQLILHNTATITLAAPASAGTTTYTFPATPDNGKYLKTDATGALSWDTPAGGGGTFLSLTDTPSSYSGQANKVLTVNSTPDAVEFSALYYEGGILQFEGTTSSYPALKRAATQLQIRLADDSAYGVLAADSFVLNGAPSYVDLGTTASNPAIRLTTSGGSFVDFLTVDRANYVKGRVSEIRMMGATSGYVGHAGQASAGSTTYIWPSAPDNGKYLKTDGSGNLSWDSPAGSGTFVGLTDTPADYTGDANKIVQVNATPDALIFSDVTIDASDVLAFPSAVGSKITYYSNTFGVGLDTGSALIYWAATGEAHIWKLGSTSPDTGTEIARLNVTGLRIGAASDAQRDLHVNDLRIEPGGAPGSPAEGDVYADSTSHKLNFHTGSAFQALGDVFGPGTSTQYAIPRYADATGTLLQNTTVLINASDQMRQDNGSAETKWGLSATDEIFLLANDVMINWRNSADIDAGATDTGLRRDAAVSVVAITDGTVGGYGKARALEFSMYDGSTNFVTHKAASIGADVSYSWGAAPTGSFYEYLRSDGAGNLDWEPLPKWERSWTAGDFDVLETNIAPLEKISGTNAKVLVRAFDYNTVEYLNGRFKVPSALVSAGSATVTFRAIWFARAAPAISENVVWAFAHIAKADTEDWDSTAYTVEQASADAASTTQDVLTVTTWTETLTNLGWSADDIVFFRLYRNSGDAGDTLDTRADEDDDALLVSFTIEIPVD